MSNNVIQGQHEEKRDLNLHPCIIGGVGNTTQVDAVAIGIFDVGYINVFFAANVKICSTDAVVGLHGVSEFQGVGGVAIVAC